jgi:hypothetical protein
MLPFDRNDPPPEDVAARLVERDALANRMIERRRRGGSATGRNGGRRWSGGRKRT